MVEPSAAVDAVEISHEEVEVLRAENDRLKAENEQLRAAAESVGVDPDQCRPTWSCSAAARRLTASQSTFLPTREE